MYRQVGCAALLCFLLFAYYLLYAGLRCVEVLDEVPLLSLQRGQVVVARPDETQQLVQYAR